MPTVTTVTVKPSGGDYSSLSGAEAGEQSDLVTDDVQLDIECYAMDDTSNVTFTGWTTDATRYIRVYTPAAERHDGKWDTSAYRLTYNSSFGSAITQNEDYVRFEGLQVRCTGTGTGRRAFRIRSTAVAASSDIRITECICRTIAGSEAIIGGSGTVTVRNTAAYGGDEGIICSYDTGACTLNADNCTCEGDAHGIAQLSGTLTIRNCYSTGGTDAYTGTMTRTTCAHSSATSFSGSTGSIAYSTANFINVSAGSEDFHLDAGASSTLLTGGTDLSGDFTIDIDSEVRSDWSIGADELIAAGGGGIRCPLTLCSPLIGPLS